MRKVFGKDFDFKKVWKGMDTHQRFSLSILVFLLVSFPVSLLLSLSPVKLFSRAQYPATPPITTTPSVTPTPIATNSSIKATLFNDKNNNLIKEEDEELLEGLSAVIAVCKLDQYNYACDQGYATRFGSTAGNSFTYIWNVFPGDNHIWIYQFSGGYPDIWHHPRGGPSMLIDIPENQQIERMMPLSLTPYPIYPTSTPPIITLTPTPTEGPRCLEPSIPPETGPAPLTVTLHGGGAMGSSGLAGYQWDFENDGVWDTNIQDISLDPVTHTYTQPGTYQPKFRVVDVSGKFSPVCNYPYDVVVQKSDLTPTPPPVSAIPSFTTRYLKPGMSGRKYKTFIKGEDKDRDKLTINTTGLPKGVELKDCKVTYSSNLSRITCEISGVPVMSGVYRPTFRLQDDTGAGVVGSYTLFILPKFLP